MSSHELEDDTISDIDGSSLFSDGDSEIVDIPTDGYFMQRQHPQQLFVENTTSPKAQEAAQSPTRSSDPPSSSHNPPAWATEQTPLLDAGPAPPDYYAATADRRANNRPYGDATTYGSITDEREERQTPGVLLEAGLFGSHRPPQSMAGQEQFVDEESQLVGTKQRKQRTQRNCWPRRIGSRSRGCLGVLLIVAIVAIVVLLGMQPWDSSQQKDGTPADTIPSPTQPGDNKGAPVNPLPIPSALPGCAYLTLPKSWQYDFHNISNFTFEEALTSPSSQFRRGGNIWIRRASEHQVADIMVTVSFMASSGIRVLDPRAVLTHDSIQVDFPAIEHADSPGLYDSCIASGIVIDVKSGLLLDHFDVKSNGFNIGVLAPTYEPSHADEDRQHSIAGTSIFNTSTFTTSSGTIDAAYWTSRRTIIRTTSGSVHGRYALRDLLSVTTTSGAVAIDVDPKKADKDRALPAVFKAVSQSASVSVSFPIKNELPDRDYETTVESTHGSISGWYIHGTRSTFRSKNGAIIATLLPFNSSAESHLLTETVHAATNLEILRPYDGDVIKHMHSKHDAMQGSGSMILRYPDEWEGKLTATTTLGNVNVHGRDVNTYSSSRRIVGRKGNGESVIEASARTGSIDLGIGDDAESSSMLKRILRIIDLALGLSQWDKS